MGCVGGCDSCIGDGVLCEWCEEKYDCDGVCACASNVCPVCKVRIWELHNFCSWECEREGTGGK